MKNENKYYSHKYLFIVGISLFAVGLATDIPAIWIAGLALFVIGFGKKKNWLKK